MNIAEIVEIASNDEAEFDKGVLFERTSKILIQGQKVDRQSKILERADFSSYIMMPTKYNFRKVFTITSLVFKYITKKVESCYEAFYKIWNDNMLPRLTSQPKWFTDSPEIKVGDVKFQKVVNKLSSNPSYPDILHPDHNVLDDSCLPAYDSQDPLHIILTTLEIKFDLE